MPQGSVWICLRAIRDTLQSRSELIIGFVAANPKPRHSITIEETDSSVVCTSSCGIDRGVAASDGFELQAGMPWVTFEEGIVRSRLSLRLFGKRVK